MLDESTSEQIKDLQQRLVELSAERSYQNAERTLSVWIRTSLSLMIFGIAIDRFGLVLRLDAALPAYPRLEPNTLSAWCGALLIALGVLMALAMGIRYLAYTANYCRQYQLPRYHGPYLAFTFTVLVAVFGVALFIIVFMFME
jgi:inner membrane protein YidH